MDFGLAYPVDDAGLRRHAESVFPRNGLGWKHVEGWALIYSPCNFIYPRKNEIGVGGGLFSTTPF